MSTRGQSGGEKTGGRIKGTPNKLTGDIKAMILAALDEVGGKDYLIRQADENPAAFMTLVGKVLPTKLVGPDGGPVQFQNVTDEGRTSIRNLIETAWQQRAIEHEA